MTTHDPIRTIRTSSPSGTRWTAPATRQRQEHAPTRSRRSRRPTSLETPAAPVERYTPSPETRPEWTRTWDQTQTATPERWYEPAPAAVATAPATASRPQGRAPARSSPPRSCPPSSPRAARSSRSAPPAPSIGPPRRLRPSPQGTNAGAVQPVAIDESSATIAVAAKVSPAVVRITVTGAANTGNGVIPETGVGSGVIFDGNGWILTNHHVVEGGEKFDVELKDGRILSGKVYGIDTLTDLAIVKVDATGLPTAAIGESDALKVGQLVVAIGSPLGTYSNSVTSGHRLGQGPLDHDRRQPVADQPHPDRRRDQPRQLGRPAARRRRQRHRHQHGDRLGQQRHRLRHPDRHRPADHGPGGRRQAAHPPVHRASASSSITRQFADTQKLPVKVGALVGGVDANGDPTSGVQPGTPAADAGIKDGDIIVSDRWQGHRRGASARRDARPVLTGRHVAVDVLRDGAHVTLSGHARDATARAVGTVHLQISRPAPTGEAPALPWPGSAGRQVSASPHRLQRGSVGPAVTASSIAGSGSADDARAAAVRDAFRRRGRCVSLLVRTSTNSSRRTGVRSSTSQPAGRARGGRPRSTSGSAAAASQQARISSPRSGASLPVEPAVAELGRDRSTEVPAGRAGGAGSTADPAPGRLGLGSPAVRTAPHRHARMVAANAPRCRARCPTAGRGYLVIVMTV